MLTGVIHQFKAENLYLDIRTPSPPTQHDDQGYNVLYAQPDLTPTYTDFFPQWVCDFMLVGENEWYVAEKESDAHLKKAQANKGGCR